MEGVGERAIKRNVIKRSGPRSVSIYSQGAKASLGTGAFLSPCSKVERIIRWLRRKGAGGEEVWWWMERVPGGRGVSFAG